MFVEARNGNKLYCNIQGEGDPVVFVHSYLWDTGMWSAQIDELKKNYKCISIELWGHGKSDNMPVDAAEYSVEMMAEDVLKVMDNLGIDKFHYVGLSVGGMIGGHLITNNQDRIISSILMDTYVGSEPEESMRSYFEMLDVVEKLEFIPEKLADQISMMFFSKRRVFEKDEIYLDFKKTLMDIPADKVPTIVALGRGIFGRSCILEDLKLSKVPTLFVVGSEDMPRPVYESEEMSSLIEGSHMVIVGNAGHISTVDNPEVTTDTIREFLDSMN